MTINAKDLKTIKADLAKRRQARLAAADDRDLSTKETILRLAPELRKMKRHGFTTTELVEVLKGHGLSIKGATLNRYLVEGQANTKQVADMRKHITLPQEADQLTAEAKEDKPFLNGDSTKQVE